MQKALQECKAASEAQVPRCKEAASSPTEYSWHRVESPPVEQTAKGTAQVLGLSHLHANLRLVTAVWQSEDYDSYVTIS